MTNDCKTCPVSTGTHKPAEAVHQIAEPAAQAPDEAQIKALMRKHRIWIEHSTLLEDDEPERELRAVQAEEHQFNAFVQDLIAATQLAAAPQAVPAAVAVPDELVRVVDLKSVGDRFYRGNWVSEEGVSELIDAALAATPPAAHPAEGVPAQCPNINEPRGCWRVACQLGGKCREPERAATQPAAQGLDVEIQQAVEAERERICAAIKAEDDHCVDQGDYMLDSNDCIKIVRGKWVRPDYSLDAAQAKQGGA